MVAPSYWKCWHHSWLGCRFSWNGSCVPLVASDRVERTKALNQAVKRNINRFPDDFMFQLTKNELESLRSQIVTSNSTEKQQDTNWKSQIVTSHRNRSQNATSWWRWMQMATTLIQGILFSANMTLKSCRLWEWRKPSGKVELLIITQMPPFRTSWLYLVSPFTMQR